jgi:hypothetical protein
LSRLCHYTLKSPKPLRLHQPPAAKLLKKQRRSAETGQTAAEREIPAYMEDSGRHLQACHQRVAHFGFRTFFERVLAFAAAVKAFNLRFDQNAPESLTDALAERLETLSAQIEYEKSKESHTRTHC